MLKLNLGCGTNRLDGYLNVDKFQECKPDCVHDLECFPWPWPTSSVSHVHLCHVLEHIGQQTGIFLKFMQELYRVSAPDAEIVVTVPHPNHRDFQNDPTHVRPITPAMFRLFSERLNAEYERQGASNSQLARYTGTDFEVVAITTTLEEKWQRMLDSNAMSVEEMREAENERLNVAKEIQIRLRVVKA